MKSKLLLPREPLLAATIETPDDLANLQFPLLLSEKKDGIRAFTAGPFQGAVSRKLKLIPNKHIRFLLSDLPVGIEGEIVCFDCEGSEADFEDTESAVMSRSGQPNFQFFVFDRWQKTKYQTYRKRVEGLSEICANYNPVDCHVIVQHPCRNIDDINHWYEYYVYERGAEGVMLRDPVGFYKFGRSTLDEQLLIKYKPWNDSEAKVISPYEEMENNNVQLRDNLGKAKRSKQIANLQGKGQMGGLLCYNTRFGEFRIGSGFSAADKRAIWTFRQRTGKNLYRNLNFRFRGVTKYGKPKHAAFVRFI